MVNTRSVACVPARSIGSGVFECSEERESGGTVCGSEMDVVDDVEVDVDEDVDEDDIALDVIMGETRNRNPQHPTINFSSNPTPTNSLTISLIQSSVLTHTPEVSGGTPTLLPTQLLVIAAVDVDAAVVDVVAVVAAADDAVVAAAANVVVVVAAAVAVVTTALAAFPSTSTIGQYCAPHSLNDITSFSSRSPHATRLNGPPIYSMT